MRIEIRFYASSFFTVGVSGSEAVQQVFLMNVDH